MTTVCLSSSSRSRRALDLRFVVDHCWCGHLFDRRGTRRLRGLDRRDRLCRLRGDYEFTSNLDQTPELRGLKTLRLLLEGTY